MNINNNTLIILAAAEEDFWKNEMQKRKVTVSINFWPCPKPLRLLRKLHFYSPLPFKNIWFYKWKNKISNYNFIIIYASRLNIEILKWIRKTNNNCRIIFWYSNPAVDCVSPHHKSLKKCELWTFDKKDAQKYALNYNRQFYFSNIKLEKNSILYDIVFVGADKNRLSTLLELKKLFESMSFRTHFHIVKDATSKSKYFPYKPQIDYKEVLFLISQSAAILDITQYGQSGQTLRPLEALFFNKKLITNNKLIIKEPFYCPNNIFVIDVDKMSDLREFLLSPIVPIDPDIKNQYDFDNWLVSFQNSQ